MKRRLLVLVMALAASGCGFRAERLFATAVDIEVRESGRSLYCNTPGENARAQLLPDASAVMEWQSARGISLVAPESLIQAPHALIEMGMRPTGGYGIAVARQAVMKGDVVILNATFVSPAPGSMRTQALSTPCVIVQLPPGRYATVEVQDQTGEVRATGGLEPASPAAEPAPPAAQ
jgi:hypothetical protein